MDPLVTSPDSLAQVRPWAWRLAFGLAVVWVLSIVLELAMSPLYYVFVTDDPTAFANVVFGTFSLLWWMSIVASVLLAAAVVVTWRSSSADQRRWLLLIVFGLLLSWGWWGLNAVVDLWGIRTADLASDLSWRATLSSLASLLAQLVSAVLLTVGGLRLRTAARGSVRR